MARAKIEQDSLFAASHKGRQRFLEGLFGSWCERKLGRSLNKGERESVVALARETNEKLMLL